MFVTLFFLGLGVFFLMSLAPGDVVDNFARSQLMTQASAETSTSSQGDPFNPERLAAAKKRLGLDLPFYQQYFRWLGQVFIEGDLGRSLVSRAPVLFLISSRMINSIVLNLISLVVLTLASFSLGVWMSAKAGTRIDVVTGLVGLFFHAFPSLLMLLLLQLFAAVSGWFPITAYPSEIMEGNPVGFAFNYLYHIVLPLFGAFLGGIGGTMRTIRATMLDQLGQPYMTALRSRGVGEKRLLWAHAFRNTMNPYITSSANLLAGLFSGSLLLEIIFAYPGVGRLMYEAVSQQDINLVLANIMFVSFLVLVGMTLSDIFLAVVDPRIRYGKS